MEGGAGGGSWQGKLKGLWKPRGRRVQVTSKLQVQEAEEQGPLTSKFPELPRKVLFWSPWRGWGGGGGRWGEANDTTQAWASPSGEL